MVDTPYTPHSKHLTFLYAELETHALDGRTAFLGTPGSVVERTNAAGFRYYVHKFRDAIGSRREEYVAGPVGQADADSAANSLRRRIEDLRTILPQIRLLAREGFLLADRETYATAAALHNHGIFAAGGILIGSHAFGVLANRLGARVAPYATHDVDVARPERLAFDSPQGQDLLGILRETGIDFHEVPSLDRKRPSTSFKRSGTARFRVDLLVPSPDETFPAVPVPELGAYATGLPHLGYLLAESQMALLLARLGCCPVRVPVPERFVVHKLVVADLRVGRDAKSLKDRDQACALASAVADRFPGALEDAVDALPDGARRHLVASLRAARPRLEGTATWEELSAAG